MVETTVLEISSPIWFIQGTVYSRSILFILKAFVKVIEINFVDFEKVTEEEKSLFEFLRHFSPAIV